MTGVKGKSGGKRAGAGAPAKSFRLGLGDTVLVSTASPFTLYKVEVVEVQRTHIVLTGEDSLGHHVEFRIAR